MKVFWTYRARKDLKEIGHYIAQNNPQAARRWVARLKDRVKNIASNPLAGRMVPEMMRKDIREVIERKNRIVYKVDKKVITVLTVFE